MNKLKRISWNTIPELIDGAAVDLDFPVDKSRCKKEERSRVRDKQRFFFSVRTSGPGWLTLGVVAIWWSPHDGIGAAAGPLGLSCGAMGPLVATVPLTPAGLGAV